MKKKLIIFRTPTNDFFLRIYAIVLAILIWFIMSITLYPTITKTIDNVVLQPIVTKDTSAEQNLLSPVSIEDKDLSIRIFGKRYEIGNFTANDLVASVIVDGVNKPGEYDLPIQVKSKNGKIFDVKDISPKTVKVKFDTVVEKEFPVTPQAPNITAAQGFLMEPAVATPSTVKISGPKTEIEKITKVIVKTDEKQVLTESTNLIDTNLLLFNGDTIIDKTPFKFSADKVEINVPIYLQKKLPLKLEIQNAPPNFNLSSLNYTLSQPSIDIAAPYASIKDLGEIHLGYLDLSKVDINSSYDYSVVLGDKYINLSGITKVSLNFDWSKYGYKYITLSKDKIHLINTPAKYDIKLQSKGTINVKLIGPKEIINNITSADVIGEIDFLEAELNSTSYNKPVQIYCPEYNSIWASGSYNVAVDVKSKD